MSEKIDLAALAGLASATTTREEEKELRRMRLIEDKENINYHHVELSGLLLCDDIWKEVEKWGGVRTPALGRTLFHHMCTCNTCRMMEG